MNLPPLRDELRLHDGGRDGDGSPVWVVHDPQARRYYRIGWLEFELLCRWHLGDPKLVLASVEAETALRAEPEDLQGVANFLARNRLLRDSSPRGTASLLAEAKVLDTSAASWLIHNYLFFRLPLVRPDAFLGRLYTLFAPLFSAPAAALFGLIGLAGAYLTVRQWDAFAASFVNRLTFSGLTAYFFAIAVAKAIHELGHALLAKRLGVRVPRMGVAFLVLFPVLYTDTTESWFLPSSRRRLLVSAGGLLAEGALAATALFAWGLSPDGTFRDACHVVAVVSVALSLAVNGSPFMRFDGYYLLSDLVDVPNLQPRAFAFTRHWLRRHILGVPEAPPEPVGPRMAAFFVLYSVAAWIYRLVVFLGIAFAVYHYFFKALGIAAMIVEIWYFTLLPIMRELSNWKGALPMVSPLRKLALGTVSAAILAGLAVPYRTTVSLPALLSATEKRHVFAPFPARVVEISPPGRRVRPGDVLFRLDAEEPRFLASQAEGQARELRERVERLAVSPEGRERAAAWSAEAVEKEQTTESQRAELRRLVLRADTAGVLLDVDEQVRPGVHVTPRDPLAVLVDLSAFEIEAFADEQELHRIRPGDRATFLASGLDTSSVEGEVIAVEPNPVAVLPSPALADRAGGPVTTAPGDTHRLAPRESLYRIRIRPLAPGSHSHLQIGRAVVQGAPESLLRRTLQHTASIVMRESGF